MSEDVKPQAITVGHLSDTEDLEYVKQVAKYGCFIGFDRLYDNKDGEYINRKVDNIKFLCENGYRDIILLSHDALFFNGFEGITTINERPRFSYFFEHILPQLPKSLLDKLMVQNPMRMLTCK